MINLRTGSYGSEPSFKGMIGSFTMRCRREDGFNSWHKDIAYFLPSLAETKFKGLWYFDVETLPRDNLANPYNFEPRFKADAIDPPVWDSGIKR